MTIHSSTLAWRASWTEEPDGLQSMGLQRVRLHQVGNTFTFKGTAFQTERAAYAKALAWGH